MINNMYFILLVFIIALWILQKIIFNIPFFYRPPIKERIIMAILIGVSLILARESFVILFIIIISIFIINIIVFKLEKRKQAENNGNKENRSSINK